MDMNTTAAFVDYVRRRKETAQRLGVSVRTLDRIPLTELPRVQVTDRIVGYRDSAILRYLNDRTKK
jgi:predicted DNA-binding transcriptional regulator AlpA